MGVRDIRGNVLVIQGALRQVLGAAVMEQPGASPDMKEEVVQARAAAEAGLALVEHALLDLNRIADALELLATRRAGEG